MYHKNQLNVGKYTSPMDPMGTGFYTNSPLGALNDGFLMFHPPFCDIHTRDIHLKPSYHQTFRVP